jgi:hypothetical protein
MEDHNAFMQRLIAERDAALAVLRDWVAAYKGCVLIGDENELQTNILFRARALLKTEGT